MITSSATSRSRSSRVSGAFDGRDRGAAIARFGRVADPGQVAAA